MSFFPDFFVPLNMLYILDFIFLKQMLCNQCYNNDNYWI